MLISVNRAAGVTATLVLMIASTTIAQTTPPRGPTTPPPTSNNLRFGGTAGDFQRQLATEALEREREGEPSASPREALIERVAPLVAQGQCDAARRLARQEGDRALSRRIGQVCVEGRPTPMGE